MSRSISTAAIATPSTAIVARLVPAFGAVLLGLALIFGAGFAGPSLLHNAAHDGRHAFAFPCH
jgi:cobalt transporter subunit CbtB